VKDQEGRLIAVVGARNMGKTWLIKLLTDQTADSEKSMYKTDSALVSTPGLMTMNTDVDGTALIFVDCHGRDDAVPQGVRNTRLEASQALKNCVVAEQFEQHLMSEFAPNMLFVMGQITRSDQETFLRHTSNMNGDRGKHIFAVHNWRHVSNEQQFAAELERVSSILGAVEQHGSEAKVVSNSVLRQGGVEYQRVGQAGKHVIVSSEGHFVMAEEQTITVNENEEKIVTNLRCISLAEWNQDVANGTIKQVSRSAGVCSLGHEKVKAGTVGNVEDYHVSFVDGERHNVKEYHFFFVETDEDTSSWANVHNAAAAHVLKSKLKTNAARTTSDTSFGGDCPVVEKNFGTLNVAHEFCRAIEAIAPKYFKRKGDAIDEEDDKNGMELVVERMETTLDCIPKFNWVRDMQAESSVAVKTVDDEARKVAETAFTYQVFPEKVADAVLKPFSQRGDCTSLNKQGLEIAVSTELLQHEPGQQLHDDVRVSFKLSLPHDYEFIPNEDVTPNTQATKYDQEPELLPGEKMKYDVYRMTAADGVKKLQWRIHAPGVDQMACLTSEGDVGHDDYDVAFEKTPVVILNAGNIKRKEASVGWTKCPSDQLSAAPCVVRKRWLDQFPVPVQH